MFLDILGGSSYLDSFYFLPLRKELKEFRRNKISLEIKPRKSCRAFNIKSYIFNLTYENISLTLSKNDFSFFSGFGAKFLESLIFSSISFSSLLTCCGVQIFT